MENRSEPGKGIQDATVTEYSLAIGQSKKWLTIAQISLYLPLLVFISGWAYFFFSPPLVKEVLLNEKGAVYRTDSVSQSVSTEGELKQFVIDVVTTSLSMDYISFSHKKRYDEILRKIHPVSMPDLRDIIRPYFDESIYPQVISNLESLPWVDEMHIQKRRVIVNVSSPPIQNGDGSGFELENGRLVMPYRGTVFVLTRGYQQQEKRYRVDYVIKAERKPSGVAIKRNDYFFSAMIPDGDPEWRITQYSFEAKRER